MSNRYAGVGHNKGPALETEEVAAVPKGTMDGWGGAEITIESDAKAAEEKAKKSDVDVGSAPAVFDAETEKYSDPGFISAKTVEGFEAKQAAGFVKVAGRHVAADGLISRRGYRRIIPAEFDEDGRAGELWADNAQHLADFAKEELRGRNATVFENLVVKPLLGQKGLTVAELAHRFGVSEDRIYRCKYDAVQRINRASAKLKMKMFPEAPKLTQKQMKWRERQSRQIQSEIKADLEAFWADDMDERVSFHTALKRCPAIKLLFVEARKPPEHIRPRSDLLGATVVRYYSDERACDRFKRLLNELRRLVGPSADIRDPFLASKAALRVVAARLLNTFRGRCVTTCPNCGGGEPRLPKDL